MSFQYHYSRADEQRPLLSSLIASITNIAEENNSNQHQKILSRCMKKIHYSNNQFLDTRLIEIQNEISLCIERLMIHNKLVEANKLNEIFQEFQSQINKSLILMSRSDSDIPYRIISLLLSLSQSKPIKNNIHSDDDDEEFDNQILPRIIRIDGFAADEEEHFLSNENSSDDDDDGWNSEFNRTSSSSEEEEEEEINDNDSQINNNNTADNDVLLNSSYRISSRRGSLRSNVAAILNSPIKSQSEFLNSLDQILPNMKLTSNHTNQFNNDNNKNQIINNNNYNNQPTLSQCLYQHEQKRRQLRSLPISLLYPLYNEIEILIQCSLFCLSLIHI